MSDLPNRLPGQAPEGQSAADIEAAMKAEGARQAMMDDLGIARVENLPLDDGSRDRVRGQRGHHAEPDPNRRQPPLRRSPAGPSLPGVNGAAWGMNQAWQDAMEARIFDDDDAEAVKDLDDLGGGRLYDTGDGSQKARVSHMTMRILNQRSVRSGHQPVGRPAASKGGRPSQGPAEFGRNNISAAATSSSHRGNNSRASAPSANSKPKANNVNPRARLANQPRARPRPALPVAPPMPETAIDPDAALSFEIENVILKIVVKFSSRDINPALPALVVLSTAAPPELGFLTVVIYNNKYCEWAMSAWLDYSTGDDNRLGITFQNGGVYQGYELQFGSQDGLREFMAAARALQTGKHPNQVGSASVPATTVVTIPVSNMLAPEPPRKTLIPGDVSLQAASPQAPAPQNVPPATRTAPGPMALAEPIAVLAAPDVSQVLPPPDVPPATPTALSPVVVPEPTAAPETPDVNDTDAASMKAFRDAAIVTCRTLLQFFYHSGAAGGSTTTVGDMDQTAEGIKSGVLEHTMESARAMGLGEQKIHMLRDAINVYFAPQPTPQPTPQPVSCEVQRALTIPRRIYSIDFLLSRRDAAVNPPRSLPNIPGLPQPGSSSRGRASSHQKGTVDQSQFSRSADAMQWVLREAPLTKPEPKEFKSAPDTTPRAPENTQPTAPNVVGLGGTPDTGLNNSRWASSALEIKNANYFTGPRYEKTWAKRTYLEELAQLDPETRITAPTEDMMEYYFPLPDADKAQSGSQASVVDGSPAPGTLGETYKMEHLNTDMSRLSIRSPTAPRSRSARLAASAETSGYAARQFRELCAQPTSTVSTPSAIYLEARATSRPSTSAISSPSTILTPSKMHSAAQTPSPPSAMTPPLVSAVSSQSPASTPSATCLEAEATPRFSQPTRVISALPATYLETQTASRLSTSAISSPSMILTSPTMSSAAQTPSHPSAMSPPVVPRVSSQSSVSIAEVPNRLRSEHGPQPPALAQTEASTPPGPLNPAPRQFPLVPAQPPAPPAAQPRVRGLAASRHSDGTAPTSSGKFNFYVPHSARQ